ncbi:hypothetical protein [Halalkalibacter okhensis]|uniref:Uncharacterized protein n=1 Tax=Halalkalibacter okhensis TaxID=333138 RepID=A0A0B0IB94_9BACI|nr:hypothetical protein [Halalkalibacter okhensis]KHF38565.1 hypothetical protein LQ50_20690 [Halalkalibacter okhensis]
MSDLFYFVMLATLIIILLAVISRLKETHNANKRIHDENLKAIKEASEYRKKSLEVQEQILEELRNIRNKK